MKNLANEYALWGIIQIFITNKLVDILHVIESTTIDNDQSNFYVSFQASIFPENIPRLDAIRGKHEIFSFISISEEEYGDVLAVIGCSVDINTSAEKTLEILLKFDTEIGLYFEITKMKNLKLQSNRDCPGDVIHIENYKKVIKILELYCLERIEAHF